MSGKEQAQPGGGQPVEWRGPEGTIYHENSDFVLENVIHTGGVIPDSVHMSARDRGVVLGAAAVLGVRVPEATKRIGGRAERREAGLTGKPSGDRRRDQIWLPKADDVAQSLEMGETASGLIVAARILEDHKPKPLAPVRPIVTLGSRAIGGLADLRNPKSDQEWLRDVVDDVIGRAYGKSQRRGRCLNGEGNAHSIQVPLLWARAVELTGQRQSPDGVLNAGVQNGFENSYIDHRNHHDGYPREVKGLYDDIQHARLAAQFENYGLLHRILKRMKTDETQPNLAQAAYAEGVTLTRENYQAVLTRLQADLEYMRQVLGLMKKDGMSVDAAVVRLRRPVRAIPGEIRAHISEAHNEREEGRRRAAAAAVEQRRIAAQQRQELRERRASVETASAAAYGRAVVGDPAWNADQARQALSDGDVDIATTHAMALAEQQQLGMRGADAEFNRLWAEAAPLLLNGILGREGEVARGLVTVAEMRLIERVDINTLRGDEVREAIVRLKDALNEAAFTHYGLGTIYSPKNPDEPMDFSGDTPENAVPQAYGGIHRQNDANAIMAGYVYERLTAAGVPRMRNGQQVQLYEAIAHNWATNFLNSSEGHDPRAIPTRLNQLLQQTANWAGQLDTKHHMKRIKDFWHLVTDPYTSEWRNYLKT